MVAVALAFLTTAIATTTKATRLSPTLPSGSVVCSSTDALETKVIDSRLKHTGLPDYSVVGANYSQWRTNNSFIGFNPTNTTPPFIQVFDPSFLDILGQNVTVRNVSSYPGFAFAHEAPIYVPSLRAVFFCSNAGSALGYRGWYNNSIVFMLNMTQVENALTTTTGDVNVPARVLNLSERVQMVHGGTGLYKGNLLFGTAGRALLPPSVVVVNPNPSYNTTVLLDNFLGRQFNSLNDVKLLPGTGIIYFTDDESTAFDPSTGQVQVVTDQFIQPNGIAFASDGKTAYATDTGLGGGSKLGINQALPATIYQYDVDPVTHSFANCRVFAYSDSGFPNGIQLDTNGNVYSGCGDGIHVWNSQGTLIGKFYR